MTEDLPQLEALASEVIDTFDIKAPPVPIEHMLQHPRAGMWQEVDIRQLSGGFLSIKDPYSPRMSLARLLARHIANSEWGKRRGLAALLDSEEAMYRFARMLIMPLAMLKALSSSAQTVSFLGAHFEVPEEDAAQRLEDVQGYL